MRYDTVFLDVDGTLLWVELDVEGYVRDLAPYASNGGLTVERATGPMRESMRRHIEENIKHRTEESLFSFKRRNAEITAEALGVEAPAEVLTEVADRRISFNPYPESERVMEDLRTMGAKLYVVSNWDILLEGILEDLGWTRYFDGVVVSAVIGSEKPDGAIFDEALRLSGNTESADRVVHVGNDPMTDVFGASERGIDTVFVDRKGNGGAPGATYVLPDLTALPDLVRGQL
ncbi:MAG TPA: HAD family hydrolase [Rubrobacteraceae bacterium]|nr:HAD family hydrolase [Rubrobacteraceae bacterium]